MSFNATVMMSKYTNIIIIASRQENYSVKIERAHTLGKNKKMLTYIRR